MFCCCDLDRMVDRAWDESFEAETFQPKSAISIVARVDMEIKRFLYYRPRKFKNTIMVVHVFLAAFAVRQCAALVYVYSASFNVDNS